MSKTQVKRGSRHRGCACRPFVGDRHRKKVAKKRGTANRKKRYANFHLPCVGNRSAHRAAYALFVGPIPKKAEIDHSCGDNRCVEPRHLDAIPPEEHEEREGRRRGVKRLRRGTPEPVEVPPRIAAQIDHWAEQAGVEPAFIRGGADAYVGRDEFQWGQDVVNSTSRLESDRKQVHRLYGGVLYLGRWQGLVDRMSALVGSLVRCEVDARLLPLREVVRRGVRADRPRVLGIPNQPVGKLSGRAKETLAKLLIARFSNKVFTIFAAPNTEWIERQLGDEVLGIVQRSYLVLEGAATLDERDRIVERARAKCQRLGLSPSAAHSLVDVARCRAWARAREDWRDLDTETLEQFLDAAIRREVLVTGCEAHSYSRAAAERMVEEARQVARHREVSPLVRFCSNVAFLRGQVRREQGGDTRGGPLDCIARRLVRDEIHGLSDESDLLGLVAERCSELGVAAADDDLETFAVDALFDAAKHPAGISKNLRHAVRRRVLSEVLVRACMREDLDRQVAERIVTEQVTLGRQQGRVTVPEVGKAVMQVIEGLKRRSLAGGEMDDWLDQWAHVAADKEHDLGAIDFG